MKKVEYSLNVFFSSGPLTFGVDDTCDIRLLLVVLSPHTIFVPRSLRAAHIVLDVYFTGAPNNTPNRVRSLEEDMRRVRLAQQVEAQKKAKKAAKENKEKEREKKHKKNVSASASSLKKDQGGDTMGRSTGYNPMSPSSGATCGFRPGRKGPSRGGG